MSFRTPLAAAVTAVALLGLTVATPAHSAALPTPAPDYCLGECSDILAPGQNGNATLAEVLANQATGLLPPHASDQLGPYADLANSYTGLTRQNLARYFTDATFGVRTGQDERQYQPRADVTVVRDRATGIPHITGTTRAGTMYGAGYVGAEDRLFTMDLLRRVGRGRLTPFAGGSPGNQALEQSLWRMAPYTDTDLQAQVDEMSRRGPRGARLLADLQAYLEGVNAYIGACMRGRYCPGEYVLTGHLDSVTNVGGPEPFTLTDIAAIGGVVGGLFGAGGGKEMESALVRVAARAKFGLAEGDRVWERFRSRNDPEAVLTLHDGQSFPAGDPPAGARPVLPDAGSVREEPIVRGAPQAKVVPLGKGMSNAVVVSGAHTTDGHPVAVFGPQTGYFAPQLLMVQELQGPGISARGAAFAGLNFYVLLGRGQDYAWSATSAGQDLTDTYALPLCTTDGSAPTLAADHYLYQGQCTKMEELSRTNTWRPSVADPTPAGSYTLTAWRTKLGLVAWRGTVAGKPHAFAELRSTYRHEAESAIGFQRFNDPAEMAGPAAFRAAAADVDYAFNWFWVDDRQTAYYNSGRNPVRAATGDPNLPQAADQLWRDYDPATNTAAYQPPAQHPQATDQDYFVSWNNKQARDTSAADGNFSFGPVQRADLLDKPVKAALAAGQKFDRATVTALVEKAGLTDLRASAALEELIRVLESAPVTDAALGQSVTRLKAWRAAGALRTETAPNSKVYAHADAIRLFDAWWPLLVAAQFRAPLGDELFQALGKALPINESPSGHQRGPLATGAPATHQGSAFQYGWWGYVDRDLRSVLDAGTGYCGGGTVAGCRQVLLDSLRAAAAEPATTTYPGDGVCAAGNQWCADAIQQSPLGGVKHPLISWQNRPTYQQVVSFPAGRGADLTDLARGRAVTASGSQSGNPAANAVDGNPQTRWASEWADGQWITVDLGSSRTVGRLMLSWEAAHASAYTVQTSTDGVIWRPPTTVTGADGGRDVVAFAPRSARFVRVTSVTRATRYGISLFDLEVYAG